MSSPVLQALVMYGLAAVISFFVALLIKGMNTIIILFKRRESTGS